MATQNRRPQIKAQKPKPADALKKWRDSLTDADRAALAAQGKARWAAMKPKEQKAAMAGVKKWQAEQRAAKAASAKAAPLVRPTPKGGKALSIVEVGSTGSRRAARKAAAK